MFGVIILTMTVLVAYSGVSRELAHYLEGCDL